MSARIERFAFTPILAKRNLSIGTEEIPWKCRWSGCEESGVSTSRQRKYCDAHAKEAKLKTSRECLRKRRGK